jgi:transcriptional regulator NrdR family protein
MKSLGLRCVACGKKMLRTVETRPDADSIRRRKECVCCKARITTIETIKKDAAA